MEAITSLIFGFSVLFTVQNVLFCFLGCLFGTLIGVLPGIGPMGAMAILLPLTFKVPPASVLILLSGIYYGAQYGSSTTAILVKIPGEASSIMTCLDGYEMARKGEAGPALGISAFASFIAGTIGVFGLMLFAIPLAQYALNFGPPEFFGIMVLGMSIIVILVRGSVGKGIIMAMTGFLLSTFGQDIISGVPRFYFGMDSLTDGFGIVPVAMGLFGVAEILSNLENPAPKTYGEKIKNLLPNKQHWRRAAKPIFRGSIMGFLMGILPGGGPMISTFASYALEKKISKEPEKFGTGMIEAVAGPEAANNGASVGAYVPLFALGIPPNATMAMLLGALIIHGVQPGPLLMTDHPEVFWGTVASMYFGNIVLLILNLPLIGIWVRILKIPYRVLFPLILLFCVIGAYSMSYNAGDVIIMMMFGVLGFLLQKMAYEPGPLILAFILGPLLEQSFHQSLTISQGSFLIFVTRPLTLISLLMAAILLLTSILLPKRRAAIAVEES